MEIILEVSHAAGDKNALEHHFQWWAEKTVHEKHMFPKTPEELKREALIAVFCFVPGAGLVAAAGIFPVKGKAGLPARHRGKRVVELGSNYISPDWRRQGIGTRLLAERIRLAKENGWCPTSVTTNPVMRRAFSALGGIDMDSSACYSGLKDLLCVCSETERPVCRCCSFTASAAWIFGL